MAFEDERIALLDLAESCDGILTTDAVLQVAADPRHVLHKHFEWDDTKAAEAHRKWQARALIARCRITLDPRIETSVRAFLSLPSDRREGGYRLTESVLSDEDQRSEMERDMRQRITYWSRQADLLRPPVRKALRDLSHALDSAAAEAPQPA